IQLASAYAAIANRGVWVRPHLVDHVGDGASVAAARRRIVSRGVAAQVLGMLKNVVLDGTGTLAAVPGYQVAGKTGTAAKVDPDGTYSDSRYVASFVGIVPASRPRLVILVSVDEPHGAIWGGVVAAPAFSQIATFDLQYLEGGITPDAPGTAGAAADVLRRAPVEIGDLAYDARAAGPGALFFCVPGARVDGHDFAAEAVANGAVALVVERPLELDVPQLVVPDARRAMAAVADEF